MILSSDKIESLIDPNIILAFIRAEDNCVKEYELIRWLDNNHASFYRELGESPSLYKKHFLLFHYLYQLNQLLIESHQSLSISSLEIRLLDTRHSEPSKAVGETDQLTTFYLNKENLNLSEEEVSKMLESFWQKYLAIDKKAEAIKQLNLEDSPDLNLTIIKKRFNQLAQKHHPDKGGDQEIFHRVKQAYNDLKLLF